MKTLKEMLLGEKTRPIKPTKSPMQKKKRDG